MLFWPRASAVPASFVGALTYALFLHACWMSVRSAVSMYDSVRPFRNDVGRLRSSPTMCNNYAVDIIISVVCR